MEVRLENILYLMKFALSVPIFKEELLNIYDE